MAVLAAGLAARAALFNLQRLDGSPLLQLLLFCSPEEEGHEEEGGEEEKRRKKKDKEN